MTPAIETDITGSIGSFLFDVEPLTVRFRLAMFAITLVAALVAALRLVRVVYQLPEFEAAYQRNDNNSAAEEPRSYLERRLDVEALGRLLEPVPSILLTFGILGTFLGLGVAISQAAPALAASSDPNSVRSALTNLLHTVSFKFQVSAWGVLFSLAFPFVVRVPAELFLRQKIAGAAERLSSAHLPSHKQVVLAIEHSFGLLEDLLRDNVLAMTQGSQEMTRQVAQLAMSVADLKSSVAQSSAVLGSTAQKLGDVGGSIDTSLQKVAEVIGQKLDSSQKAIATTLGEQSKHLSASLVSFSGEVQKANAAQVHSAETQSRQLTDRLGAMNEQLSKSLSTMNAGLQQSLGEQLRETTTLMQGLAQDNRTASQAQTTAAEKQSTTLSKQLEVFSSEARKANLAQNDATKEQSRLLQQGLDRLLQETKATMAELGRETTRASQEQTDSARKQSDELTRQLGSFQRHLERHMTAQQGATEQMNGQLRDALVQMSGQLGGGLEQMNGQLKGALDKVNQYQANMQGVLEGQQENMSRFNGHLNKLLELLDRIQASNGGSAMDLMALRVAQTTPGMAPRPGPGGASGTGARPMPPSASRASATATPDEEVI